MSLYTEPPTTVNIDGEDYPINSDFREWIKFQAILLSDDPIDKKTIDICNFLSDMGLPATKDALDATLKFYAAASTENNTGGGKNVQSFDFKADSEYIFSAFFETYGIDLTKESLHWWRFKALFKALPEECQFCKIMMYRTIDLKNVPKEQRKFYREMKERYALKSCNYSYHRTEQEMKEYVKNRFAEAKMRLSEAGSDK